MLYAANVHNSPSAIANDVEYIGHNPRGVVTWGNGCGWYNFNVGYIAFVGYVFSFVPIKMEANLYSIALFVLFGYLAWSFWMCFSYVPCDVDVQQFCFPPWNWIARKIGWTGHLDACS